MSEKLNVYLGYEIGSGKPVKVPTFHMLVTGQTRLSGKTTTLKALAKQVVKKGFKVLVFDTKTNFQDYEGFGDPIPVCLKESTDALPLIYLVEGILGRRLTMYYPTLTRVTEGAKNFEDIINNATALKGKPRTTGFVRDACTALIDLLKRLQAQTRKHETTAELKLPYDINKMAINDFEPGGQQLIVKTVFEEALKNFEKLIIILDEAYKFMPQKYRSACSKSILDYVTQSGATECYLWLGTQFLATTSKDAMKTMAVKLLGTQDHVTECEHTLDLIPFVKGKINADDIMRLALGHFIVVTKQWVKRVYVVPELADKNECKEVALGLRTPKEIHYLVKVAEEDLEKIAGMLTKEDKTDTELKLEGFTEVEVPGPIPPNIPGVSEPISLIPPPTPLEANVAGLQDTVDELQRNVEAIRLKQDSLASLTKDHRIVIAKILGSLQGKQVDLTEATTNIKIKKSLQRVSINTDTARGKILVLAKEGFFGTRRRLRDICGELEDHRWTVNRNTVKTQVYKMSEEGLLGRKKEKNREYSYALSPNIVFDMEEGTEKT